MKIELSEHFTYKKIILYTLPNIGTMLAITSFQMADGFFVSNWLGVKPFAAVNLVLPILMLLVAPGFMIGGGGSAFISKLKGEGKYDKAREYFTMLIAAILFLGVILGVLMYLLLPYIMMLLGASDELLPYCLRYGRIFLLFLPCMLIETSFQSLWVMAEKPVKGFRLSMMEGLINIFLDWLFVVKLGYEVEGAAAATGLAMLVFTVLSLSYFVRPNDSGLHFERFRFDFLSFIKICYNGSSEMVDAVSANIVELIFNLRIMFLIGEIGVVAFGVYSYVNEIFLSVFFALSTTAVTVVGYKYGANDLHEIRSFARKSAALALFSGLIMTICGIFFADEIAYLYVGYDTEALEITTKALKICSLGFLLYGFNILSASIFTGLHDGTISGFLALIESLIAPIGFLFILPDIIAVNGIWLATPAATVMTALIAVAFLKFRVFSHAVTKYYFTQNEGS